MDRESTLLLPKSQTVRKFVAVRADCFQDFIGNDFGIVQEFCLEEVINNWMEFMILLSAFIEE